jgi:hypothetical protein
MTNLAPASLALVLRAVFGGAKSCALVNFFMICPRMVSWWLTDNTKFCLFSRFSYENEPTERLATAPTTPASSKASRAAE